MKSGKLNDIKAMSTEALVAKVKEDKLVFEKLKFAHSVSPIENPMRLKFLKKDIARMLTELTIRNK